LNKIIDHDIDRLITGQDHFADIDRLITEKDLFADIERLITEKDHLC
jgi:hypothetical protein